MNKNTFEAIDQETLGNNLETFHNYMNEYTEKLNS